MLAFSAVADAQGYPGGGSYPGSYIRSAYSGGTVTKTSSGNPTQTTNYNSYSDGTYGGGYYASGDTDANGNVTSGTATCAGSITATIPWNTNGNPNNVPPPCVILKEYCGVFWNGSISGGGSVIGACNNPLGGVAVPYVPPVGQFWDYTRYTEVFNPSAPLIVSCDAGAHANSSGGGPNTSCLGGSGVRYSAQVFIPYLQGHSTVDTANWDPTHPRFFSGTNCTISGTAQAYSAPPGNAAYPLGGSYVTQAMLYVGGTLVKSYYDTSTAGHPAAGPFVTLGTNQSSAPLSVVFDSTHFADGSAILAQMTVTDSSGFTYNVPIQANAYNKGYDGGGSGINQTNGGAQAASFVQGQYLSANITPTLGPSDSKPTTLNSIPTFCDFFTYAHGIDDTSGTERVWFGATDNKVDNFGNDYHIFGSHNTAPSQQPQNGVAEAVAAKSVNQPAYNLVFLDTCNSIWQYDLVSGFGISTNPNSDDDRAFLGWETWVEDSLQNADWVDYIYQDLQNGQTIGYSVSDADTHYPLKQSSDPTNPHYYLSAGHGMSGDGSMTLHGTVYGGLLHQWFK